MTIKQKCDQVLKIWIESGDSGYKLTGAYWEVLYPLLKKYSGELLKKYEHVIGEEFTNFNEEVFNFLTKQDEEKDFVNAINYMNAREDSYATTNDIDYIDIGNDRIIPYMPNQWLDETIED